MKPDYKPRKIGVSVLCRVSAKGGAGVYLYVPRNFAEVYGIDLADYVETKFEKAFTKTFQKDSKAPQDLTPRTGPKKKTEDF